MSHLSAAKKMQSPSSICSLAAKRFLLVSGEKFHDRRFPFAVFDLDKREPFAPKVFAIAVSSSIWPIVMPAKSFRVDRFHDAAGIERAAKHFESAIAKDVAQIDQLHSKTAIRFVAAESADRFVIGQAIERRFDFDAARRFEDRGEHSFGQRENVFRRDKRGFDIDLGEFRLAIGAQIFVAKTFRDLKIFFDPATMSSCLYCCGACGRA